MKRKRRSTMQLEREVREARTKKEKAMAHYHLALFHDNNSRELKAIPSYEKAIRLGLERETKAQALAWLASSLYKTRDIKRAERNATASLAITKDEMLRRFLVKLKKRISKFT